MQQPAVKADSDQQGPAMIPRHADKANSASGGARQFCCAFSVAIVWGWLSLCAAGGAQAQNFVTGFVPIGYSPDARYFAYEEFGVTPQAGRQFATVSVLDVVENRWVLGTPATVESLDPDDHPGTLRDMAMEQSDAILSDLSVNWPATYLTLNGDGLKGRDPHKLSFGLMSASDWQTVTGNFELTLETFDTSSSASCAAFDVQPVGFALSLANFGQPLEIYRDGVLPRSRGCPIAYELKAVIVPFGAENISRGVVMIAIDGMSEEGLFRTYFPVPLGIGLGRLN